MNIAINAFVTFLLSISIHTSGQGVAAYIDKYDRFKIYDNGVEKQIEYLEIQSHKFGPGYVAYVDNAGEFKVYYRGKAQSLNINRPHFYQPTNNLLVYWDTKILRVLDNNKLQSFPNVLMGDFVFGDSVLGIIDRLDYFHAYYQGRFWEIDQRPITAMAAGDNMLVYVDEADEMVIFKHGETEVAETEPPIYFEIV